MSTTPFFQQCFQAPKTQSQKDQELQSYEQNKARISSFPLELGWGIRIRHYQSFWFPEPVLPGIISLQQNFNSSSPQHNIFLVTYPKSGTTWIKALAFTIINRPKTKSTDHPVLSRHSQDCAPYLESFFATTIVPDIDLLEAPRLLGTHIPYSVLPESIKNSGSKIVYLCREPKDTLVSMWHFANAMRPEGVEPTPFDKAFELFHNGVAAYGPVWDHQLEYWKESLNRPDNVLFLKYEDMKENSEENVRKLAEFMGMPFTKEEERDGVIGEVVRLCSFENLKGLDVHKEGERGIGWSMKNSSFFRKGMVGDWREHLNQEMAEKMDRITQEKLSGFSLSFRKPDPQLSLNS